MGRAYRKALTAALSHWRLVLFVFVVSLLGGLTFMGAAWLWLAEVLDASLATRTLATGLDVNVFIDIVAHHGSALRLGAGTAILLTGGGLLLWTWINLLIVTAVTTKSHSLGDALRRGAGKYRSFLALGLLSGLCNAVAIAAVYAGWSIADGWAAPRADEITRYGVLAGGGLAVALALLLITTVHDHARVRCLDTMDGAGRSFIWAWGYVLREPRALVLATLLLATTGAIWLPYQVTAQLMPTTATLGLTISLVWAQMFMMIRVLVRVWAFAAAAVLQESTEEI